jgi:hypothetical protein
MADLSLRLLADAAGAQGAFKDFGSAVTAAGAVLLDFSKQSVKAFAEAERVQKQLTRAAGENADAFSAMAEAMSAELAVEDEHVKKLQTLALNYGVLPQQVEGATRAVLDYAAATGRDATSAMQQLLNGVEQGTGSLGRMGVSFVATGDKAKDMAAALEAMNAQFSGAAAADADSLDGRMRKASIAAGELEEAWGGFLATVEAKTGVLEKLANVLRNMSDSRAWTQGTRGVTWEDPSAPSLRQDSPWHTPHLNTQYGKGVDVTFGDITLEANKKKGGGGGGTKAGKGDFGWGPWGDPEKSFDGWLAEYEESAQKKLDALNEQALKEAARVAEFHQKELEAEEKHDEAIFDAKMKAAKMTSDFNNERLKQEQRMLDQQTKMWARAGMEIGQAVINGVFMAIEQAVSGDKKDDAKVGIGITRGIFNAIFSAFGMGWMSNMAFGAMDSFGSGGALGGAAAFGAGTASAAVQMGFSSHHNGGWIERFHMGGPVLARDERMAILQTGERVLSRGEVARMGGMGGVDSAAHGGGRPLVIQAFDSSSILDFFGDRGGRGMLNAARANVGPLRLMFGKTG